VLDGGVTAHARRAPMATKYSFPITQEGFRFDVFFDTKLDAVNAYYVTGFPSTFFIDKGGNLVTGSSEMPDFETLEKGITA